MGGYIDEGILEIYMQNVLNWNGVSPFDIFAIGMKFVVLYLDNKIPHTETG